MTFEKEFEQIESEEYDRQRHHLQNLQRADFFSPSYRYISYEEKEELFNKLPKESIASSQSNTEDQLITEKNLSESDQSKLNILIFWIKILKYFFKVPKILVK